MWSPFVHNRSIVTWPHVPAPQDVDAAVNAQLELQRRRQHPRPQQLHELWGRGAGGPARLCPSLRAEVGHAGGGRRRSSGRSSSRRDVTANLHVTALDRDTAGRSALGVLAHIVGKEGGNDGHTSTFKTVLELTSTKRISTDASAIPPTQTPTVTNTTVWVIKRT